MVFRLVIAIHLYFLSMMAIAQVSPVEVISTTVDNVITDLQSNRDQYQAHPERLYEMVERNLLPSVDMHHVAKSVVGKYWRKTTDTQKQQFIKEFKTFLMKSYAQGIFQYDGQKLEYKPARFNKKKTKAIVDVFLESSERNIPVSFKLIQGEDSNWRIFNVVADGINLVANFRSSYGSIIQEKGFDGLISSLAEKNNS